MVAQTSPLDAADYRRDSTVFLLPDGGELSYPTVRRLLADWQRALASPDKALVACLDVNPLSTVLAYLAALAAGHAVALLDPATDSAALDDFLTAYQPEFVVGPGVLPETAVARRYRPVDRPEHATAVWRAPSRPDSPIDAELALLLLTSGSTGGSKSVRLSGAGVMSNALAIAEALDIQPSDRAATSLPLHYCYGLSVLNSHLVRGASVALFTDPPSSQSFWRHFARTGCTSFAGVPSTYERLTSRLRQIAALPRMRVMTQAGGHLREELVRSYSATLAGAGARFFVMYGQTEATARIACLDPRREPDRIGSVGTAIPGGSIEIRDEAGLRQPDGVAGKVWYRGPNVMHGYARTRQDLSLGDQLGGRLDTGDLGLLRDGYLYLVGRTKRISKIMGKRLGLDDLEWRLGTVSPTAAIDGGDCVVLFAECPTEEYFSSIRQLAADLVLPYSAFRLHEVEALPRLSSGKVDYQALTQVHSSPERIRA